MKTCYLYFYDGHLSVSPTTISLAQAMGKIFDKVVVFCKNTAFDRYTYKEKNVETYYMNDHFLFNRKIGRTRFFIGVLRYMFKKGYSKNDMFICIDDRPLKYCNLIYKWFKIPFAFLSLELFAGKKYKKSDAKAFKNTKAILIQDEERLKTLLNKFDAENLSVPVFNAPNISIDIDKQNPNLENMTEQFDIAQDKTKCACIGMIYDFVYSFEIAKAFKDINNSALIYHDRREIDKNDAYIKKILDANPNIYLSSKVYDYNDIGYVYDGIDIGIACYRPSDNKYDQIGHSSGKLTFYLKYKKPVIVNRLDGYSDIVEKYDCGVIINDVNNTEEWQNAVNKINSNYQYYSNNSYKCYMEEFDFMTKIKPFLDFSKKLTEV